MILLIPLFAAIMPFFLWPIETLLPYPYLIEEAAKLALIIPLLKLKDRTQAIKLAVIAGVLFAFSETVLYMFNIFLVGRTDTLIIRLLLTIPLHTLTTVIILASGLKDKKYLPLGLAAAIVIHFLFNNLAS